MKSVLVRRPANVDVLESHRGAETIPIQQRLVQCKQAIDVALRAHVGIILFCIRIFTQVRMRRSLSRRISRKDSGSTS